MKLISNYKDYYDYLIGIYGIDEKAVYNRTNISGIYKPDFIDYPKNNDYQLYMFAICGIIYLCYYYKGNFYFGEQSLDHIPPDYSNLYSKFSNDKKLIKFHLTKTDLNEKENEPILLIGLDWRLDFIKKHDTVKLSDFQFGKILKPEEIYLQINNFLLREKQIKDNRTNKEHIESAGFDYKHSFRNTK